MSYWEINTAVIKYPISEEIFRVLAESGLTVRFDKQHCPRLQLTKIINLWITLATESISENSMNILTDSRNCS